MILISFEVLQTDSQVFMWNAQIMTAPEVPNFGALHLNEQTYR